MARTGANNHSDHMLVVMKSRATICRASNTKPQQMRSFAVDRLKNRDVASRYYDELESEPQSLDEKCKKLEETIQRVATNTIGYTTKQTNKKWLDEECAKVNEEKNATRERAIQIKTRGAKNADKLARSGVCSEKRQSSSTKRLKSRFSDIGVLRTLVNFTSA
jgi:hypothetical protein